jgi:hypothetical protein
MDDPRITTGNEGQPPPPPDRPPAEANPPWQEERPYDDPPIQRFSRRIIDQDRQYLNLLTIFNFVLAGLTFLIGLCPLFGIGIGIFMVSGGIPMPPQPTVPGSVPPPAPPMEMLGWMMVAEYSVFAVILYGSGILAAMVGWSLTRRKHWMFCVVGSGILCLFMPLGTVLGVFTIIVLVRESVKYVFQHGEPKWSADEDYA